MRVLATHIQEDEQWPGPLTISMRLYINISIF